MGTLVPPEEIDRRIDLHPPRDEAVGAWMDSVRAEYKALITFINGSLPSSREASLALTNLEDSLMWAIASIARRGQ